MKKRILSILTTLCLLATMLPVTALAAETCTDEGFLSKAGGNDVITLTDDTTITSSVVISAGTYTVNLNGHTLKSDGNFILFDLSGTASLTITGPGTVSGARTAD